MDRFLAEMPQISKPHVGVSAMLDPRRTLHCENMLVSYLPHLISPQTDELLFQIALTLCKRPLSQYYLNMYQIILMRFQSGVLSF